MGDAQGHHGGAQALGDAARLVERRTRQQQDEFLAAVARGDVVLGANLFERAGGDPFEAVVAGLMAVEVVVSLETVDVVEHHGNRRNEGALVRPEIGRHLFEPPPVGEPRQRVVPRLQPDFRDAHTIAEVEQIGAPRLTVALKGGVQRQHHAKREGDHLADEKLRLLAVRSADDQREHRQTDRGHPERCARTQRQDRIAENRYHSEKNQILRGAFRRAREIGDGHLQRDQNGNGAAHQIAMKGRDAPARIGRYQQQGRGHHAKVQRRRQSDRVWRQR